MAFEFSSVKEGAFRIKVTAFNRLGTASDSLDIQVMDGFKISDITNWTGSGENQSMLAIQWITGEVENWSNLKIVMFSFVLGDIDGKKQIPLRDMI